jgi:hypothetical protein
MGRKWRIFIMEKNVSFKQGEEKREELELPTLHFVVMDQWLDVIGEKALLAWLKFYTWCDRDRKKGDKPVDINLWEQSKIPDSFAKIRKKLGVGNDTFYNQIIKPLWNVGLIDIEEWENDTRLGTKAMNIVVYKYPQNNKSLSFTKIQEVRNYDTDYSSHSKSFARKGGRPKKDEVPNIDINLENLGENVSNSNAEKEGSLSERGGVLSQNGGGSLSERGGVLSQNGGGSEIGDNNILNTSINSLNILNKSFNTINNLNPKPIKIDKYEVLWDLKIPKDLKTRIKVMMADNLLNISPEQLFEIEDAYSYQIEKGYIIPDCDDDNTGSLNDRQFTQTIIKMLEKVKDIENMRGLIQEWVVKHSKYKNNKNYKDNFDRLLQSL